MLWSLLIVATPHVIISWQEISRYRDISRYVTRAKKKGGKELTTQFTIDAITIQLTVEIFFFKTANGSLPLTLCICLRKEGGGRETHMTMSSVTLLILPQVSLSPPPLSLSLYPSRTPTLFLSLRFYLWSLPPPIPAFRSLSLVLMYVYIYICMYICIHIYTC